MGLYITYKMSNQFDKITTVLLSEGLLIATTFNKLQEFGWVSFKTFMLAGVAAIGSLVFKELFNYCLKKCKEYGQKNM